MRCDDSMSFTTMGGEDCSWIARDPARCNYVVGSDGTPASEACPAACNSEMSCTAPRTTNFVWIQESVSPTLHTTASWARPVMSDGDRVSHDTYFMAWCDDDYAADYSCVVHCSFGEIDYKMCGPGGPKGKGESFVDGTCVPMHDLAINQNCAIPWESPEVFGPVCFDGKNLSSLGTDNCGHTWQQWWDMTYDYAANYAGQQFDLTFRQSNDGNVFLPHGTANLVKLGLGLSNPETRFSTIYGEGWFTQIIEDWLPEYCNQTNNTAKIPAGLEAQFPTEFLNQFLAGAVVSYDQLCGPDRPGTNLKYSGYIDILGPINLFTLTSSSAPDLVGEPMDLPFFATSYAADAFTPESTFDGYTSDGAVFWPELNVSASCFFDFIPMEFCNNAPGPALFANTNPTSYAFDTPVQIDSVGLGSYDPCIADDDPVFMGLNSSCFHFHQGGPHFRNGQMAAFYPILLDGTPDFFGVCTDAQMKKANLLKNTDDPYGLDFSFTDSSASILFEQAGGINVIHGKSFGIHFCVDPNNTSRPVVCTLNHFSGFPKLEGLADQMVLSPLSFSYEWYTDRVDTCAKSQAHYCPYDDYWFTVETVWENIVTDTPNPSWAVPKSSLNFDPPRLNFLFCDRLCRRSKLIILVETKKFLDFFASYFVSSFFFLIFWFSGFLIF